MAITADTVKAFDAGGTNATLSAANHPDIDIMGISFKHIDGNPDYLEVGNNANGSLLGIVRFKTPSNNPKIIRSTICRKGDSSRYSPNGPGVFDASGNGYLMRLGKNGSGNFTIVKGYDNYHGVDQTGTTDDFDVGSYTDSTEFSIEINVETGSIKCYKGTSLKFSTTHTQFKTNLSAGYAAQSGTSRDTGLYEMGMTLNGGASSGGGDTGGGDTGGGTPTTEPVVRNVHFKAADSTSIENDTRVWPEAVVYLPNSKFAVKYDVSLTNGEGQFSVPEFSTLPESTQVDVHFVDKPNMDHVFVCNVTVDGLPATSSPTSPEASYVTGLQYHPDTHQEIGGKGDNWTMTWAADNSTYISMCDGDWFSQTTNAFSSALYKVNYPSQTSPNFSMSNVQRVSTYPTFGFKRAGVFVHGIVAVNGLIYCLASQVQDNTNNNWNQYHAMKLLRSSDNGQTWYRIDKFGNAKNIALQSDAESRAESEFFIYRGQGITHTSASSTKTYYPFVQCTFLQDGQDYQHGIQNGGYLYIYSPDPVKTSKVNMARVKWNEIEVLSNWEYFKNYDANGNAVWTSDMAERGIVYSLRSTDAQGNKANWYSGLPDATWNPGLGQYVMVNGVMYNNDYNATGVATSTGSLTFFVSEKPYGPWREIRHIDHFKATSDNAERTYQPKLDPKNMSADGKDMWLIWSDHAGPFTVDYYTFHQMKFTLAVS